MPYSYATFAQLKQQLAERLSDSGKTYWTDEELGIYLTEALRTFGVCSGFWRDRGSFNTTPGQAFYGIPDLLSNGSELILDKTVTDRDIIKRLQFALLESTTSQTQHNGTEMFTYADFVNAIQNRLNQFISDTGLHMKREVIDVASPPIGRQVLDQDTVDVRRVAWKG